MVSEEGTSEYGLQLLTVTQYLNTLSYRLPHLHTHTQKHTLSRLCSPVSFCIGLLCNLRFFKFWCLVYSCMHLCVCLWMPGCRYVFMEVCHSHSCISHSILTIDVWWWSVYRALRAMSFLDSLRLSLSFSLLHLVHFARFNPLPLIPMSFPLINLVLSRFSDKKLERGKWNFALIFFFLSFPPLCPLLALNHLASLFLAVNWICISFHTQGPSEIKLYTHFYNIIEPLPLDVIVKFNFRPWVFYHRSTVTLTLLSLVTDQWEGKAVTSFFLSHSVLSSRS